VFNAFPCSCAVPDTPGKPVAAYIVLLRDRCCLRPIWRGSAFPIVLRGYLWVHWRYGPRTRSSRASAGTSRFLLRRRASYMF
jgi:hypothetical protein